MVDTDDEIDLEYSGEAAPTRTYARTNAEYTEELDKILGSSTSRATMTMTSSSSSLTPSLITQTLEPETKDHLHDDHAANIYGHANVVISEPRKLPKYSKNTKNWKCLIQYEEEEYINKHVTTITTRTISEDILTFENVIKESRDRNILQAKQSKHNDKQFRNDMLIRNVSGDDDDDGDEEDDEYETALNQFTPSRNEIPLNIMNALNLN